MDKICFSGDSERVEYQRAGLDKYVGSKKYVIRPHQVSPT